jgi:hypothetical protein
LPSIITGDESWIYGYDPDAKQEFSQWKMKSKVKSMLIIFFNIKGLFTKNSSWQAKQSIQHTIVMFYGDCMKMCEDFTLNFGNHKKWLLHHDNAPSHTSFFTREIFTKTNMTVIPHPPYSTHLTWPPATFLFPQSKIKLKGRPFDTTEGIEAESQAMPNLSNGICHLVALRQHKQTFNIAKN